MRAPSTSNAMCPKRSPAALLQELGDVEVVVVEVEVVARTGERLLFLLQAERLRPHIRAPAVSFAFVTVEAGCDHGDADLVAEGVIDHGPEDDVGVRVRRLADDLATLLDLQPPQIHPAPPTAHP